MSEIANCPFCGSPGQHYPDGDMEGYSIMCSGTLDADCPLNRFAYPTAEAAGAAWNRRATQPASDASPFPFVPWSKEAEILTPTQPASAPVDPWHKAAMEECMSVECCYYPDDPARTIKELIDWHVKAPAAVGAPQGQAEPVAGLIAAADAVVERWHSRDWKQPPTADYIHRLAAAVGAAKRAPTQPTQPAERED